MSKVTLAWLTDTHCNFLSEDNLLAFAKKLGKLHVDGYVITGDISEGPRVAADLFVLQKNVSKPIYFVLGNHDMYDSSTVQVRKEVTDLMNASLKKDPHKPLHYLRGQVIQLNKTWSLIGTDGWADAQLGTPYDGGLSMADWTLIRDYEDVQARYSIGSRIELANRYGLIEAGILNTALNKAVQVSTKILVLTHIPPFKEATWHRGKHSDNTFLPWFSCKAIGDVLMEVAETHPNKEFLVLTGHTHGSGQFQALPNLLIKTGGAEYRHPEVQDPLIILDDR